MAKKKSNKKKNKQQTWSKEIKSKRGDGKEHKMSNLQKEENHYK